MSWYQFDNGKTIGQKSEFGGIIIFDEVNDLGARIYVEKDVWLPSPQIMVNYFLNYEIFDRYKKDSYRDLAGGSDHIDDESELIKAIEELKTEIEKIFPLILPLKKRNYQSMANLCVAFYYFGGKNREK